MTKRPKLPVLLSELDTLIRPEEERRVLQVAQQAEDAGYDGIHIIDHIVMGPHAGFKGVPENPRAFRWVGNQRPDQHMPSQIVMLSAIVLEHVTRLRPDIAPVWPQGSNGPGCYVIIEGDPKMTCHFDQQNAAGDHVAGAILATAARVVNAIPAVCQAQPGLLTALDPPLVAGRGLMG
jgi:hypothetical protein